MEQVPESCRTCTRFLNDKLPEQSCYTHCPKLNNMEKAEVDFTITTIDEKLKKSFDTALRVCPSCGKKSLFWNKVELVYECLNPTCKVDSYEYHKNDNVGKKHNSYLDDGGWGNR